MRSLHTALCLSLWFLFRFAQAFDPSAAEALGEELYSRQAYGLAVDRFQTVLRERGSSVWAGEARLGLGESLARLGRPEAARRAFQDYLDRNPGESGEPRALLGRLRADKALGHSDEALKSAEEFQRLFGDRSEAPTAAFERAEALYGLGRFEEADLAYAHVSVLPDIPGTLVPYIPYARGWCSFQMGMEAQGGPHGVQGREALSRAAAFFSQATSADPESTLAPLSMYQEGESRYASGDFEGATKSYQRLLNRFPSHDLAPPARYSVAWCAFSRQDWAKAADTFYSFTLEHTGHPLAPWAKYMTGVCLARLGNLNAAETAYRRTLLDFPGSAVGDRATYGLAWLATMRKDPSEAARQYESFLKQYPGSPLAPSALFLLGDAQFHLDRTLSARQQYLTLVKRYPSHPLAEEAAFLAAACALAQEDYAQALTDFQQFAKTYPQSLRVELSRLRAADCLYGLGKRTEARQLYGDLLAGKGSSEISAGALNGLAWCAFAEGDWTRALSSWRRLLSESPSAAEAPEARLHAGDCLYNLGRYAEALQEYRQADQGGAGTRALEQSGWALYRLKDFPGARREWAKAAAKAAGPADSAQDLYWSSWALFREGRFDEAAASFGQVAERFPDSHLLTECLLRRADSLYNAGHFEEARQAYQVLVDGHPEDPKVPAALYGIQWCWYSLGREDEAVAASKAFLQKYRDNPYAADVQYRVAEHYLNHKDYLQAEKEFDVLEAAYPKTSLSAPALFWRGMARFKVQKFRESVADWRALLKADPSHPLAPKAQFQVGMALYRLQEYPDALVAFRQVLDAYGDTPSVAADAQFNMGMTYKRMDRTDEALEAYRKTMAMAPESALASMARIRVGYIHEDGRRYDEAIRAYRELATSDKGKLGAEAQFLVGDCQVALKQSGEALLSYQEVVDRFPSETMWVVSALAKMAELHEEAGEQDKALACYRKVVALGGNPQWVESAKRRIERIEAAGGGSSTKNSKKKTRRAP